MSEKRERRCETCAAWNFESHSLILADDEGLCQAHAPDGRGFGSTCKDGFCLVDYTPLDMMNGAPDVEELLTRMLHTESTMVEVQLMLKELELRA